MKDKTTSIQGILQELKPNTVKAESPLWEVVEGGLLKLSLHELNILRHLLYTSRPVLEKNG